MAPAVPLVMRYCCTSSVPRGGCVVRITSLKLTVLALLLMELAFVPAASATTTDFDIFLGSTQVATAAVTTGGSCAAGNICITITGFGGNLVRTGGPTVGFSGTG